MGIKQANGLVTVVYFETRLLWHLNNGRRWCIVYQFRLTQDTYIKCITKILRVLPPPHPKLQAQLHDLGLISPTKSHHQMFKTKSTRFLMVCGWNRQNVGVQSAKTRSTNFNRTLYQIKISTKDDPLFWLEDLNCFMAWTNSRL